MRDIKERLHVLDQALVPDLWEDASTRSPDPRASLPPAFREGRDTLGRERTNAHVASWRRKGGALAAVLAVLAIAVGAAALTAGNSDTTTAVIVTSGGMMPTLRTGQHVAVDPTAYASRPPSRGDVIVFRTAAYPDLVSIKRVIGLPGDVIEQSGGLVLVNGEPIDEPYAIPDPKQMGPWTVQPGHVFVMGDNRPNSNDSRYSMGQIPFGEIEGEVLLGETPRHDAPPPGSAPAVSASR